MYVAKYTRRRSMDTGDCSKTSLPPKAECNASIFIALSENTSGGIISATSLARNKSFDFTDSLRNLVAESRYYPTKMQSEKQNITKTKVKPLSQGRFNLRWLQPVFMFFVVLLFFSVAASVSAAWPPDPYAGCVGKALDASCDGATYGYCRSSNWYGCKATPSACKVGW